MVEKLIIGSAWLKERISIQEDELISLRKTHQLHESKRLTQIQELEIQLMDLKAELEKVKKRGVFEVRNVKKDLESIEIEKHKLQLQLESEKTDYIQSSNDMEKRHHVKIQELEIQLVDVKQKLKLEKKGRVFEVHNLKKNLKTTEIEKNKHEKQLESEKKEYLQSLNHMEKSNLELINKVVEKKIDEMAEEFCKHFEDKLHILRKRIKTAKQLQVGVNEWYSKTKETYAHENKDITNVKDMSSITNNIFGSLDVVALRFEECTANYMNRISKVSCELKFVQDWVMRKNKAITHVKDYQNCLLAQLDEKEAKILVFRERVWRSENTARELGKLVKENEETMLRLKEEKRAAIRQLCVWIDYHRSRSDYYKKTLADISLGCMRLI